MYIILLFNQVLYTYVLDTTIIVFASKYYSSFIRKLQLGCLKSHNSKPQNLYLKSKTSSTTTQYLAT